MGFPLARWGCALSMVALLLVTSLGCGSHDSARSTNALSQPPSPKPATQPATLRATHGVIVMDDFESGSLTGWRTAGGGSGGWFVYTNGGKAPDPARSDPRVPFRLPNPPGGRFAAVADTNRAGTRILYRDVKLDGRFRLHLTAFYAGVGGLSSPPTLAYDEPHPNEQFRIDLLAPSAPIDSVAPGDVLVNIFATAPSDPDRREPTTVSVDVSRWAGQTVRLRLAATDNHGPLRAGVDDIRFEPIGPDANARIELPQTKDPTRALNLPVRMTEANALKALSAHADELAGRDELSGALLIAKDDRVLFSHTYGLADRKRRIPNTRGTRFRIGSMNKMFTAAAILQLVDAGKVKLTAPVGTYLPGYPNRQVATKVTIHQLLTHTGGTGDIFGPSFDAHRKQLRTLADYVSLYGKRGLQFEPGSQWVYSNYGFILLGVVIERVTGQSYYDYVQQHIYAPAGMTRSGSLPENQAVPDRSIGYTRPSPGPTAWVPNTDRLPYRGTSAGGGYSTVEDLARFAHALLTHKLLSPDTTKLLITGKINAQPGVRYAYGFFDARTADGNGWVGHSGGTQGINGDLRIYAKSGYVIVVLANLDPPAAQQITDYLDPRLPTTP